MKAQLFQRVMPVLRRWSGRGGRARWGLLPGLLLLLPAACSPELGEARNPIKVQIVPSQDRAATLVAAQGLLDHLSQASGLAFALEVPERYIDLVVALGEERADLALMNDLGYLLAHDEYGAEAALAVRRGEGGDRYRAIVIVRADSGLTTLEQLQGKRIAYVDVHSVSGYILPAMLLQSKGIAPAEAVAVGQHEEVVRRVLGRSADAGFTYEDSPAGPHDGPRDGRMRLLAEHPTVLQEVVVLARTESVPNEPFVFGRHVPPAVRARLVQTLLAAVGSPEGRPRFAQLNDITSLSPVTDRAYDSIRQALAALGKKPDELVPGGGILELKRLERSPTLPPLGH